MAFGFIGKLVELLTGKKSAPQKQKTQDQGGNGRGKHGKRGRHGKNGGERKGSEKAKKGLQTADSRQQRPQQQRRDEHRRDGQRRDGADVRRGGRRDERRHDRGGRGDRGRRGPVPVNTAANEMRPGGVVTPEELAKRQAAHAAWSIEQFAVPQIEGRRRG